ncbi:MAG: hypothetical protein COV46_04905 [Deltaproteobacteria bacterium CG11_big_fil_rev_8_21_14_0_20_49_13]|nr:MAG: hypothetical protein COV46_04905 [Deltaproteobacteria bacterium CG11_big_fil_rev_8_21_14_0_20_49_13]
MKKLITVVAVIAVFACTNANATDYSVGKGNWLVGAAADLSRIWGGGVAGRTTFNMNAEVGYFVWDWLMPEAKFEVDVTSGYNLEIFTAGARAYWNKKTSLLPYARLNVGVASSANGDRYTAFALNPGIGLDYMITKNVAIGIQANYTAFIRSSTTSMFDFPVGFSIYF